MMGSARKWVYVVGLGCLGLPVQAADAPVAPSLADTEARSRSSAENFKDQVLAMCLAEAYRHDPAPSKDLRATVELLGRTAGYDPRLVDEYVTPLVFADVQQDYFNPVAETEVRGVPFDLLKCLDLYHDPILDRVVKKLDEAMSHQTADPRSPGHGDGR